MTNEQVATRFNGKQRKEAERKAREASALAAANRIAPPPVGHEAEPGVDGALPILSAPPKTKRTRKPKSPKPCECGCGGETKGGRFIPGHDSKLKQWCLAVERGACKVEQIPSGVREAVVRHMKPVTTNA